MKTPVLAPDGCTYEKDAIIEWLSQNGTSPKTYEPMRIDDLLPNHTTADLLAQNAHLSDRRNDETDDDYLKRDNINIKAKSSAIQSSTIEEVKSSSNTNLKDSVTSPPMKRGCKTSLRTDANSSRIPSSTTKEFEKMSSPNERESTVATLHVTNDIERNEGVLSARVHIQTPNPSLTEFESSIATPCHICCVIDCSSSMFNAACSKDQDGNVEDVGLSILDIVKFSTLVIAESLNPRDKLSIVTFSSKAATILPPTNMTLDGKGKVKSILADVKVQDMTNIFAGVELGLKQAHNVGNEYINSVFLLTDGYPTINPPQGHEVSITEALSKITLFGSLSTFGFGYNLDSRLLTNIAKIGGGYYSHVTDTGMVGTCFTNALANSKCAYGVHPVLKISGYDIMLLAKSDIIPWTVAQRNSSQSLTHQNNAYNWKKESVGDFVPGLTLDEYLETRLHTCLQTIMTCHNIRYTYQQANLLTHQHDMIGHSLSTRLEHVSISP